MSTYSTSRRDIQLLAVEMKTRVRLELNGRRLEEAMWVFPKIGVPQNGLVKIMVPNPMNKWMIWGGKLPLFLVLHTHVIFDMIFSGRGDPFPTKQNR